MLTYMVIIEKRIYFYVKNNNMIDGCACRDGSKR